jgi:hypothetical protein
MTYNGLLHEWKILSASRAINTMAGTSTARATRRTAKSSTRRFYSAGACCASRPIKFLTGAPSAGFSGRWATKTTKEFETT